MLLAFSGLLSIATNAHAVACASIANTAWNVQTTWGPGGTGCAGATGGIPGAGDTVTITNGNAVTVTAAAAATSITIAGGLTATGLTITGAFPLTVSGAVAINAPTGAVTKQIVVGTGTLSAGSITITAGAAATNISRVTLTTGTITVSGNISFGGTASAARLIYTGTGTVNLTGNLGSGGTLTTVANCILNFNGSAAQTAASYTTYRILKVNNAAGLTMLGTSTVATLTIGDVTGSSVFNDGGFQVTSAGTLNLTSGTLKLGAAAAATTFPAFATGNITAGTTVEYASGVGQTVSITPAYQNLTFSGGGTKTTAAGTLSVAGNWDASSTTALNTNNTVVSLTGNLSGTGNITQGTGAMTVSGNLAGSGTLTQGAALISVAGDWTRSGAFTASATGVTLTGSLKQITGAAAGITFTTLTVNGSYTNNNATSITVSTALAGSSGLTNPAAGTLNIAGTSGISALTATAVGNIVNYTGAAQTVKATAYHHLGLSGSGAKTMTSVTTIAGNLSVSGTATMTGNAGFTVAGALNYSSTAGTTTLTAATPVSIGSFAQSGVGGTLNDNGNTITVTGTGASTWTKSAGTFTASGTVKFTGAAPQIGASNFNNLTIDVSAGTATLTGNATPAGNLAVTTGTLDLSSLTANRSAAGGTLTVANGAKLKIGSTNTFPTNYTTHTLGASSTVEYSGTAQAVTAETYGNLTLSGSGNKTIAGGTTTIAGNLSVTAGTYLGTTNNPVVNLAGDFSNTGTFTSGTGLFTLNGSAVGAQSVSGTPTFANLTINNTGGGVTLGSNVTVSSVLTFTGGVVTTNASTLITSASCSGSITRTSGHVAGFLQLAIPAGSPSCTFHVGDGTTYRPIGMVFASGATAGNLTGSVSQSAGEHPNIATSDLESTEDVNRFWTLTNSGVGLGASGYDATFTFVAGDVDASADTASFEVRRWNSPNWFITTAGTRTATSTKATGILAFSDFAVGKKKTRSFTVAVTNTPDTCTAASITITAKDKNGNPVTNYTGTINISTSPADGDWAVVTGGGTLDNGTADDGVATYAFVSGDSGVVSLTLSNVNEDKDLTITVVDSLTSSTSSNSSAIQYRGNFFQITNDTTLQIAGKSQPKTVTLKRGASCSGSTVTAYPNGNHALKAWYTPDTDHPGGATAPAITGASPAITTSVPGTDNLTLSFTSGTAPFTLTTTDVGKYVIRLRDDSTSFSPGTLNDVSSPTITTRPFGLAFRGANDTTAISHSTSASATVLAKAGASFTATVAAYLWQAADDTDNDGIPDAGADITNNGLAPRFAWPVTITAGTALPAAETTGTLLRNIVNPATITQGTFSGGAATISDLQYSEVGSVTLVATASDYLNTSGVTVGGSTNGHSGLDGTGAAGGYVGRFYPDHFALTAAGTPTQACGGFSYLGQSMSFAGVKIEARNAYDGKTKKYYDSPGYARLDPSTFSVLGFGARDSGTGVDFGAATSRIASGTSTGNWTSGELTLAVGAFALNRNSANTPDGPHNATKIGVAPTDDDGVTMQTGDFNIDVDAAGGNDHARIGGADTSWRFGRLRMSNAFGSEKADLGMPVQAQYWSGNSWVLNSADSCTSLPVNAFFPIGAAAGTTASAVTIAGGSGTLTLTKPTTPTVGNVDVAANLGTAGNDQSCLGSHGGTAASLSWLRSRNGNCATTYDRDPSARGTFGLYRSPESRKTVHVRENY